MKFYNIFQKLTMTVLKHVRALDNIRDIVGDEHTRSRNEPDLYGVYEVEKPVHCMSFHIVRCCL